MFNGSNYSLSDIAAVTGTNRNNEGGWGDNGSWWIIILFLFAFCGWGGNGWGNNGNGAGYQGTTTREEISYGFDMNGLENGIRGVQNGICDGFYAQNSALLSGFNGVQNSLCQGFNGVNTAMLTSTNALQQDINAVNIAAMQNANALQTQIADCCCKQDANMAQLRYDMATDACAITNNVNNNVRDLIENQNANARSILEAIQQNKIDAMQERITVLAAQNQNLQLAASQAAQNAYLINELKPCPSPCYVVPSPYTNYTATMNLGTSCCI